VPPGPSGPCCHAEYGPAQRLYGERGYVPDGRGVTIDAREPSEGETVVLDDSLVLTLMKSPRTWGGLT